MCSGNARQSYRARPGVVSASDPSARSRWLARSSTGVATACVGWWIEAGSRGRVEVVTSAACRRDEPHGEISELGQQLLESELGSALDDELLPEGVGEGLAVAAADASRATGHAELDRGVRREVPVWHEADGPGAVLTQVPGGAGESVGRGLSLASGWEKSTVTLVSKQPRGPGSARLR